MSQYLKRAGGIHRCRYRFLPCAAAKTERGCQAKTKVVGGRYTHQANLFGGMKKTSIRRCALQPCGIFSYHKRSPRKPSPFEEASHMCVSTLFFTTITPRFCRASRGMRETFRHFRAHTKHSEDRDNCPRDIHTCSFEGPTVLCVHVGSFCGGWWRRLAKYRSASPGVVFRGSVCAWKGANIPETRLIIHMR